MSENQKEIDRDQLKIERKIRKKLKKDKVREQNQKDREKAALLKLQSTDHRIQIITDNSLLNSKPMLQCSCVGVNLENADIEQFPSLNLTAKQKKIKIKPNHNENCSLNILPVVSVNKKSNAPITVDIAEVIEKIKKPIPITHKKHVKKLTGNSILSGNILDSDNPLRRHGKIRENKKPHLSQLKKQINKEKNCMEMGEQKSCRINKLCDNCITPELNSYIERLLKDIADFYYRQFQDSTKTVHKKRFIVGFHEIEKYMPTKNVKLLIIASNLQEFAALNEKINKFKDLAINYNIPYVFALSRRHMSRCLRKQTPVSCVAVLNYFGSEENYHKIIDLLNGIRSENDNSSLSANDQYELNKNEINEKVIERLVNKMENIDLI